MTVLNSPPDVYSLYTHPYPSFPGQDVEGYAYFSDPDDEANYTCEIDWGEGSIDTGTYEPYGECVFPPHSYSSTGSYTLQASVTDGNGAADTYTATHKVVHLYAEESMYLLASNTPPHTLRLRGYAPRAPPACNLPSRPHPRRVLSAHRYLRNALKMDTSPTQQFAKQQLSTPPQ